MYDNPCNHCESLEKYMPRMHMPMANMPMANMPMGTMPMANMPMANMPMMTMPIYDEDDEDDEDLRRLYPKIYMRISPIVTRHCDMIEDRYGTMYCPSKEEMDQITEDIYDRCEDYYRDDYGSEDFNDVDDFDADVEVDIDNDMRQRRRRRRRRLRRPAIGDLIRILFLRDLIGRRRFRRRPYYGYGYGY